MPRLLLAFVIAAAGTSTASAQLTPLSGLRPGDTLRVWAVEPRLNGQSGTLDAARRDSLRFTSLGLPPTPMAVGLPSLRRVDVKRGVARSPGRIILGSLLGAGVGMFAGAALGTWIECGSKCGDSGDLEGLAGLVLGGATGIVAGGVTGGLLGARHRSPKWEWVDISR